MKLCPTLCIALSLLGTVLSDPIPFDNFAEEQFERYDDSQVSMQDYDYQPDVQSYADTQGPGYGNIPLPDAQSYADTQGYGNMQYYDNPPYHTEVKHFFPFSYVQSYADIQGGGSQEGEMKLPEQDLEEMKKQNPQEMEELAETEFIGCFLRKYVRHGNNIVIQNEKTTYLTCPASGSGYCSTNNCPGINMDTTDWTKCAANVFTIYHRSGPGVIRVGDYVAFHFPTAKKWFSMYRNSGHLQIQCPGNPHKIYGFHRKDSWQYCGSEVFRIHAEGKKDRAVIESGDIISLYFPAARQYLRLDTRTPSITRCPGTTYPPNSATYDRCPEAVFNIRRK